MIMTHRFRKLVLTVHITSSVGWFGAVASFLTLAITGLTSTNILMVRSVYLAMELITWFIIIPLSFASLLTGIVQSLGTRWGLFRHYWILIKLLLIISSIIVLLIHIQPISYMANLATKTTISGANVSEAQIQLVIAPAVSLLVLLVAVTLAVYKPKGMTPYGQRKREKYLATSA